MALDRTNMVSLLDIGKLFGGASTDIVEMGDGYTEISEDWGPGIDSTQYVNMKAKSATVSGYEFTMNPEREYLNDDMQKQLDKLLKKFPTGEDCKTDYYRFFKTDEVEAKDGVYEAIKLPIVVAASSAGGEGGGKLVSSIQINGNGAVEEGYITMAEDGTYTWSKTLPA